MSGTDTRKQPKQDIVFYDGVCPLCNGAVRILLKIDKRGLLKFAPLQGEFAQKALNPVALPGANQLPQSIVLLSDSVSTRSDAIIGILKKIGGVWRFAAGVLGLIPRSVRDALYIFVARRRYSWFGSYDECPIPDQQHRDKFLQ